MITNLKHQPDYDKYALDDIKRILAATILPPPGELRYSKKDSFAPSSLVYGENVCPRKWHYMFQGVEGIQENTPKQIMRMKAGAQAHERIQNLFMESGLAEEIEREIRHDDPPVHGFIDMIIKWQDMSVPVEIKTTKQEIFVYLKTTQKVPDYHLAQILFYMYILDVSYGFMLYENTNDNDLLFIPVEREKHQELLDNVLAYYRRVFADINKLPERPFRQSSKICKGCPLRDSCWKDERTPEVKILPLEIL